MLSFKQEIWNEYSTYGIIFFYGIESVLREKKLISESNIAYTFDELHNF